ncbi:glycoside hydrolase family 19 protein [Dysgonomonas sp. 520]|uniref:glycoside hydrolase family 19 protein n=1 Tax=Dysgonomonas sp. 520 TaxID=2302931 RepID=UPI0013D8A971|nr:glycoside hydrolase family 19 protein [Dysgonomonas sp. 520]NDW10139.1 glycoside hydrolase family 19 protein [Dysgonomonas sp. 520]
MKTLTNEILKQIYPLSTKVNRDKYLPFLVKCMEEYEINTVNRTCMFLAQIGHESGQLRYCEEIASGAAYEGRRDLGNTQKGDGKRFKGRGLIQITGRSNYTEISKIWNVDFVSHPELLSTPEYAVKSACWWWKKRGLNEIADRGDEAAFRIVTRIINGGYNGYQDRFNLWNNAKKVLI